MIIHAVGCGKKETLNHCWWECKLLQPVWKSIWHFLRRVGINLERSTCTTLSIDPKNVSSYHKNMFFVALYIIARHWKQPRFPSTEESVMKMWYIYTVEENSFGCLIKWQYEICRQMDGTGRNHPEWDNPDPEIQICYAFSYMWILTIE